MHDHWLFTWNVLSHWVASMSSIVSFTLGIVELVRNKKTESWVFFAVAFLFLIFGFDQAWQDEHRNAEMLKAEKSSTISEREFWKQQSYDKDQTIQQRDQLLAQNYTALIGEQSTANKSHESLSKLANKILDITKPEPLRIYTAGEDLPFYGGMQPHEMMFLAFPNRILPRINVMLTCDTKIKTARAHPFGAGTWMGGSEKESNKFFVNINTQWADRQPLVVYMSFEQNLPAQCTVTPI